MAVAAERETAERRSAERIAPSADDGTEVDGRSLDPHEVLERLEPADTDDIDRAPRGIVYGTLIGAVIWAAIYAIYELAL